MDDSSDKYLLPSQQHGSAVRRPGCGLKAGVGVASVISIISLVVASVALTYAQTSNTAYPTCDVSGYYKCLDNSFCVGTEANIVQGSTEYFTSASNGLEYDYWEYLPTGEGQAAHGQFVRMEIHGGCANDPCTFHEQELYTPVPGTILNWEGFTVNRTGATNGVQVFYENVYFKTPSCDSYVKIVKGQLVQGSASGVLCHNECTRTTKEEFEAGIHAA